MDEWESVRSKIRELEGSFLGASPEVRTTVDTVSVADFWKRRYEEEKQLWEEKLAAKEKEQSAVRNKFEQDEQGIRELDYKVKLLEQRLEFEKQVWEERSKVKAAEAELEKKRVEWEARIRAQDEEIGNLRSQLRSGAALTEEEAKRRQQIEAERSRVQQELAEMQKRMEETAKEEREKISKLEAERAAVQRDLDALQAARKQSEEKSAAVEKELSLLTEERDRHFLLLAEREKENFETFENLTRGFVHRVRNHLSIMSGTAELCLGRFKMEDELKNQVSLIGENAKAMHAAVEDFLSLACLPEMSLQPVNANELLTRAIYGLGDAANSEKIAVEQNFSGTVPAMAVDAKLLDEGLRQVLLNAVEASAPGGKVVVSSSFDRATKQWTIEISDQGSGIAQNHLKKIFQPYFTTKKGRRGLGLCVAKRAVDLHHGTLSVASGKERGTAVTIRLPQLKA